MLLNEDWTLMLLPWIVIICIQNELAISQTTDSSQTNATTTTTEKTLESVFREIRKNKTAKDADLIIKMTRDFVIDMQQKRNVIKRVERVYSSSVEFSTGSVFSDITRRFQHMCDLYKQFATVRRYVMEQGLNQSMAASPDVIIVFEIMLSDYNEILMLIELFRVEMLSWKGGSDTQASRDLIQKQMLKFGNIPAKLTPPRIVQDLTVMGTEKNKADKKANKGKPGGTRRWGLGRGPDYPQKWSGELDGVGFDER